jgi:hypothetical protein
LEAAHADDQDDDHAENHAGSHAHDHADTHGDEMPCGRSFRRSGRISAG